MRLGPCRVLLLFSFFPVVVPAWAQQYSADKPVGTAAQSTPAYLKKAGISQNLGKQLPLNDRFLDSSGNRSAPGRLF